MILFCFTASGRRRLPRSSMRGSFVSLCEIYALRTGTPLALTSFCVGPELFI